MCWFSIAKYLLFIANFVLWAAGAAVLGVAIYLVAADDASSVVSVGGVDFYASGCYVLIAAGSFALVIGFLGCCGASKESTCLLGLYFTCLLAIFILEVGVGIWALVNYDSIDELVSDGLGETIDDKAARGSWITMEQNLHCCGAGGCQDWNEQTVNPIGCQCDEGENFCEPRVAATCNASYPKTDDEKDDVDYTYIYTQNCTVAVTDWVEDNMTILAGIGLGIGLAEIFGMIFSMCMCQAIKDKNGYA